MSSEYLFRDWLTMALLISSAVVPCLYTCALVAFAKKEFF